MRGLLSARKISCELNLDDLLRPADAFSHPQELVCDPDLSINEKRYSPRGRQTLARWRLRRALDVRQPAPRDSKNNSTSPLAACFYGDPSWPIGRVLLGRILASEQLSEPVSCGFCRQALDHSPAGAATIGTLMPDSFGN